MSATADRELLGRAYHDVEAAVKAAKTLWPGTAEGTQREAAADFLVHVRELRRSLPANGAAAPGSPGPAEVPPSCPDCAGPMKDQRTTRRGNQPHYKCARGGCDGAVWLDRKRAS